MISLALLLAMTTQNAPALPLAPPIAPVASAAPNPTAEPEPAKIAAASKLIESLHIDAQYDVLFTQMLPPMTQQVFSAIRNDATIDPRIRRYLADDNNMASAQRFFATESLAGFKARYAALKLATAKEYARAFTLDELAGLANFYASPLGQKTLSVQPLIEQRLFPIGADAGRDVGADAMRKTLEKLLTDNKAPQT